MSSLPILPNGQTWPEAVADAVAYASERLDMTPERTLLVMDMATALCAVVSRLVGEVRGAPNHPEVD